MTLVEFKAKSVEGKVKIPKLKRSHVVKTTSRWSNYVDWMGVLNGVVKRLYPTGFVALEDVEHKPGFLNTVRLTLDHDFA